MLHAMLAGCGMASIVMRSAELYQLLRLVGAAYLVGLGLMLVHKSWRCRRRPNQNHAAQVPLEHQSIWMQGRRAFLANLLNVKAASVYLTLAPQFIPASDVGPGSMAVLAVAHVAVMVVWLGLWSVGLISLAARFNVQAWKRRVDTIGGAILVLLGVKAASETV